jgi:hypothetical protein
MTRGPGFRLGQGGLVPKAAPSEKLETGLCRVNYINASVKHTQRDCNNTLPGHWRFNAERLPKRRLPGEGGPAKRSLVACGAFDGPLPGATAQVLLVPAMAADNLPSVASRARVPACRRPRLGP